MPIHKGIELFVISQVELKALPEFQHPESSQFTNHSPLTARKADAFRSPNVRKACIKDWKPPSASPSARAHIALERSAVVAVYIPSVIGAHFWLRYNVTEPKAINAKWLYFKLYFNGRQITSWGINAAARPRGQIMRGLFEPSEEFNYTTADGTVMEKGGAEARPFFFGPGPEPEDEHAFVTDGGLIEVVVFRARGRKRRIQAPSLYKHQEDYGIIMPSQGLLPHPEDAKYYDWHLKDPKDNPYAIFRFHYRSWDTLKSLHLVPENHPMESYRDCKDMLFRSPRQVSPGVDDDVIRGRDAFEEENVRGADGLIFDTSALAVNDQPGNQTPFDDSPGSASNARGRKMFCPLDQEIEGNASSEMTSHDSMSSLRNIKHTLSRIASAHTEKPWMTPWNGHLPRPLPEIPTRQSSLKSGSMHSRQSSTISNVPSITASLRSYVDREQSHSPEPEFGIASFLSMASNTSSGLSLRQVGALEESHQRNHSSLLIKTGIHEEESPSRNSLATSKRRGRCSNSQTGSNEYLKYPVLPPDITHRKMRRAPSMTFQRSITDKSSPPSTKSGNDTIILSESEWITKTPSPVKKRSSRTWWSPGLSERKKSQERFAADVSWTNTLDHEENVEKGDAFREQLDLQAMDWYKRYKASDDVGVTDQEHGELDEDARVENMVKVIGSVPANWI